MIFTKIWTDGATVGHNGKLGTVKEVGLGVYCSHPLIEISKRIAGGSNNEAEFLALIEGMNTAIKLGLKNVDFFLDSQIVVNRAACRPKKNGKRYRRPSGKHCNDRMDKFQDEVIKLKQSFERVDFHWIPREQNEMADALSKKLI